MKLPIPSAALAQHILVLGKTRSGKSSTLRVMVEQLLDDKKPVCIIDPKGDWWGIKSSADGKKAGYDVVIFGGTHADVPINAHSGKVVAELVATGNRPCLIDLGGWMVGERTKFFIDFASTLFTRTHGHRWLVVDECHNFAPQGKVMDPQAGMSLHWANRLASEGAGKGIVLMSASQRPQKVHKDYVTSHETLIAKRVIHPLDRDAMKEWIDGCGDPKKGKEVLDTLAGLQRSQGWVWSPEIDFGPKLVEFPMFGTYDSFAVQTGKAGRKLKGWASVDLDDVKAKLAAVVQQEKANDPKELRAQLVEKDKEIKRLQGELTSKSTTKADPDAIKKAEERGFAQAEKKLKSAMRAYCNAEVVEVLTGLQRGFEEPLKRLAEQIKHSKKQTPELAVTFTPEVSPAPAVPRRMLSATPAASTTAFSATTSDGTLTRPQLKLLQSLAWWKAMGHDRPTRPQVAAIAGWTPAGSNLKDRLSEVSKLGLVVYPMTGVVQLTPEGEAAAPTPDTDAKLIASIRAILTGPQLKLFDALYSIGQECSRVELAEAVGWEPGGSNLKDRLSELSRLELVTYPQRGTVALQEWVAEDVREAA